MQSKKQIKNKDAQSRQDTIFRRMSADRKIELMAQFWKLAKELSGKKILYAVHRPTAFTRIRRAHS